ncbi:polysaccharide export protein, partial [Thioalkalivibrio sp.]|uniref:polysaccharide export protein n=1 Tax=Thioalkalivibrio sp. TaxID=2093813 RepID=UPI00356A8DF5
KAMVVRKPLALGALVAGILATGGCSTLAPGVYVGDENMQYTEESQAAATDIVVKVHRITPELIARMRQTEIERQRDALTDVAAERSVDGYRYHVGPLDILSFTVFDHPELTIPAGEYRSAEATGHRVDEEGFIFFPYIGKVEVAGLTTEQIRQLVTDRLRRYIQNPQVDVRVAAYRSKRVNVTGEVRQPGTLPITDVPMTILEALNGAGGYNAESADLSNVRLTREDKTARLDLYDLLEDGETERNILLQAGDTLHVPDSVDNRVFVFGEVRDQGVHYMSKGEMSLADALGQSRGPDQLAADASRIYVLRGLDETRSPDVYQLDANRSEQLVMATRFELRPMDVVFVSTSDVTRWNRVISQLLPTVRGIYEADRVGN